MTGRDRGRGRGRAGTDIGRRSRRRREASLKNDDRWFLRARRVPVHVDKTPGDWDWREVGRRRGGGRWESCECGDRFRRKTRDSVQTETATVDQSDSSRLWPVAVWKSVSTSAGGNEPSGCDLRLEALCRARTRWRGVAQATRTPSPQTPLSFPTPGASPAVGAHHPASAFLPNHSTSPLGPAPRRSTLTFSPLHPAGHTLTFSTIRRATSPDPLGLRHAHPPS